jgi:vacuolar-type H+-ATPase catalytic subunit A/Vma1
MTDLFIKLLKNMGCSHCQEYEFQENYDNYKSWKLYLKEYEMYSAMILYNNKLKKDISYLINKNEVFSLLNDKDEIFIKLEFISKNENDDTSILVPTDDYQELYEKIEQQEKVYDKKINAYYIGTFDVRKNIKN